LSKKETNKNTRELVPNPEQYQKDIVDSAPIPSDCDYSDLLNNPKTPKMAKELFNNTAKLTDEPLDYFEYILNGNENEKKFYFRIITNSYKISDGAYSEGLGSFGKEYIETQPDAFASFFDQSNCFTDDDLKIWAKIALLEFQIIDDSTENNKNEALVYGYCRKLIHDSKKFSKSKQKPLPNSRKC